MQLALARFADGQIFYGLTDRQTDRQPTDGLAVAYYFLLLLLLFLLLYQLRESRLVRPLDNNTPLLFSFMTWSEGCILRMTCTLLPAIVLFQLLQL